MLKNIYCIAEYVTYSSHLLTTLNGSVSVFIYFLKHSSCLSDPATHQRYRSIR